MRPFKNIPLRKVGIEFLLEFSGFHIIRELIAELEPASVGRRIPLNPDEYKIDIVAAVQNILLLYALRGIVLFKLIRITVLPQKFSDNP